MTAPPRANVVEIRRVVALLCEPGEIYEVRALGTVRGTASGYFNDFNALVEAVRHCSDALMADGVYLTLNPANPDLLARSANRILTYAKYTTSDKDILRRRWLLIDADPCRPAGISSTDVEHALALERALVVREHLSGRGWPAPIVADSGNGYHLLYRVDLPNDEASKVLLQRVLETLHHKFSDDRVSIDRTTFNAARISKIYGSMARKGSDMAERPHRLTSIGEAPDR